MTPLDLFYEDFSRRGRRKLAELLADAYPDDRDAILGGRVDWPRPMLIINEADFGGLVLNIHHSGDEVTRGPTEL